MIFILVTIAVSIVILFLVELILGTVAFWINTASNRVIEIAADLITLTSGSLVQLNLNQITQWFIYSPFAFAVYHPMQIYLGKYSPLQTLYFFLGGVGWCVLLYIAAKWLFKIGLKRNEAVGL
jgi:ABC-2 type transport system permease protein